MTATLHTNGHLHTAGLPVVHFAAIEHAARTAARHVANVALLLAAPFIGLVYAMALPFVGLAMLAVLAARALAGSRARTAAKNVLLFVAAPLVGLVYAMALPLVGTAMIARIAYQAVRAPAPAPAA